MILFKKLLRTILKYKAQFISMLLMVILGVGIFVGFNAEWYSIEKDTLNFFNETKLSDYQIINTKGFKKEDLNRILDLDGITDATRFVSFNALESKEEDTIKLNISEDFNVSTFKLMEGNPYDSTLKSAIWLSENYASKNNYHVGDSITLSYNNASYTFHIEGICMSGLYLINLNSGALMPDYDTMGYAYVTPSFYESISEKPYYPQIHVLSSLSYEEVSKGVDEKLKSTLSVIEKSDLDSYSKAMGEASEGKTIGLFLPIIFLAIAILTMICTMNRITTNEHVQIGILKALGFRNKRIIFHYTLYAFVIGFVGSLVGLILGYGIALIFFSKSGTMGTYFEMPYWKIYLPWFTYLGIIVIILFLTLIGYLSVRRELKGSAAMSLRPYEGKKMKSLLIEKGRLFKHLSFISRYNLRDSFRHKARMIVSIFGVFGSTLLIFASLGMKSTMNDYIDLNFNKAMYYENVITVTNLNNESTISLAKDKSGDFASINQVKLNGKSYQIEILNNRNHLLGLVKKRSVLFDLNSEGAYIGNRMASELNLKVGDTFKFSFFGSDEVYSLPVYDIVNLSDNGFVISTDLADKLSIQYQINAIYTKENVDDLKNTYSILSKSDIMKSFDTFLSIMNLMIFVLVIFSLLLAFIVLYNLGTLSYIERYRELSTLKVLGFKNKRIRWILIEQNMISSIFGILLGIPLGYVTLVLLFNLLESDYELTVYCKPYVYIFSIILTFIVSFVVSFFTSLKIKNIDMVESLKEE